MRPGERPPRVSVMEDFDSLGESIAGEAGQLGVAIDEDSVRRIAVFLRLVEKWGQRMNLTGRAKTSLLVQRHLPDALAVLRCRALPTGAARVLDIGAGAGLTGIPLALLRSHWSVCLVEPLTRRCSFLRTARQTLSLPLEVIEGKVENAGPLRGDVVLSRATWAPELWLERASGLVSGGGVAVVFAARSAALPATGALWQREEVLEYRLGDGTPRVIGCYRADPPSGGRGGAGEVPVSRETSGQQARRCST